MQPRSRMYLALTIAVPVLGTSPGCMQPGNILPEIVIPYYSGGGSDLAMCRRAAEEMVRPGAWKLADPFKCRIDDAMLNQRRAHLLHAMLSDDGKAVLDVQPLAPTRIEFHKFEDYRP